MHQYILDIELSMWFISGVYTVEAIELALVLEFV